MNSELQKKIEGLVEDNPKHFYWKIKSKHKKLFEEVEKQYEDKDSFSEGLYLFLYGDKKEKCDLKGCSNPCVFRSFTDGYRSYCSKKCSQESQENKDVRKCEVCESEFEVRESRTKKICSRECWREWNRREEVQERFKKSRKNTLKEKYGDQNYVNAKKAKKTKEKRYGDPNYNNLEKIKSTMEEKYGGMGFQSDHIFEKSRKTNLEKYGVKNPAKLDEFKKKASRKKRQEGYDKLCSEDGRFKYIKPLFDFESYQGRYKNSKAIEYDFKCIRCQENFIDIIRYPIRPRCPNCFPLDQSISEKELQEFLISTLNCEVKTNHYGFLKGNRELDVYIPDKNVAIEFNGIYWHSENGGGECGRNYHLNKTEECEDAGIQLIHIFENEWEEKKEIVKERLKYIIGEYGGKRVYARNTKVKEIGAKWKNEFLSEHHLQGEDRSNVKLGLFHEGELVSVMTFSKRRVSLGGNPEDESWELSRFCSSCSVVGGASKLFSHFAQSQNPEKVVTYADRRWSSLARGTFYEKIGFDFDGFVRPSYFYFEESDKTNLKHRFSFRKNVLSEKLEDFDPDLTEWENMKMNGFDRIWDCGKLRYVWSEKQ